MRALRGLWWPTLVVLGLVLSGCSLQQREAPPQPTMERLPPQALPEMRPEPVPEPPRRERLPESATPSEPAPPDRAPPPRSAAAEQLAQQSSAAVASGDLQTAAAQLERALRIAPRDANLWLSLARVRFQQGAAPQSEQMAMRAIQLAGNDTAIQREAWELVAASRELRGDRSGAEQAREAAEALARGRV